VPPGWAWVGPCVEEPFLGARDCDEALGKFLQGLGNLPELYVKANILSREENMAK
jgi:hypothetical protein